MTKSKSSNQKSNPDIDLSERISLVMKAYDIDGHVSRKSLMNTYGLSQIQAGALMRDFIHAHAISLEWHPSDSHYKISEKPKKIKK
jgi:hypothetical protein